MVTAAPQPSPDLKLKAASRREVELVGTSRDVINWRGERRRRWPERGMTAMARDGNDGQRGECSSVGWRK
ncbi:hypothetical protein E2562_036721 [Oryza meyeriana var. granulata]|uniref:Uncharacterized protein n=1 Tax=Oryza meyeriana var. granulata TaxID=110450 RepID=A0A6G1D9U2_9ORYZ|nr:hypothetical protein E2562_036721 [Oryza meyeriana var. granulata]